VRSLRLLTAGALVASAALLPAVHATAPATRSASDAPLGRYVVQLADGRRADTLKSTLTRLGVTQAVAFETINAVAITAPESAVHALIRDGVATAARTERKLQLHLASSTAYIGADQATIGKAAKTKVGRSTYTRPGVNGTGHTVAVLDTGINDAHPDLLGRVTAHLNFELAHLAEMALNAQQLDTFAVATGDTARTDDIGHGTHVAGIVGGTGVVAQKRNNNNRGVAPGAKLVDLRIAAGPVQGFYDDAGWERNAIAAFDWLLRHHKDSQFGKNGIRVNTNSWGLTGTDAFYGKPDYEPLGAVITQLDRAGLVTVFSAGNDGAKDNVTNKTVPNGLPEVISVAASCKPDAIQQGCSKPEKENDIATFSSRGPAVDIAAPGVEIVSAVMPNAVGALAKACPPADLVTAPVCPYRGIYGGKGATPADIAANYAMYGSLHGTSMAGPHIAGVVALMLQANPRLTPKQVQMVLAGTATDRQARGRDIEAGWGLVNVPGAVLASSRLAKEPIAKVLPRFRWAPSM
jgi:serine protease AprX